RPRLRRSARQPQRQRLDLLRRLRRRAIRWHRAVRRVATICASESPRPYLTRQKPNSQFGVSVVYDDASMGTELNLSLSAPEAASTPPRDVAPPLAPRVPQMMFRLCQYHSSVSAAGAKRRRTGSTRQLHTLRSMTEGRANSPSRLPLPSTLEQQC